MANQTPQNLGNHGRFDPQFHFFVVPVFVITVIVFMVHAIRHLSVHSVGLALVTLAALVAVFRMRIYSLKVQDRVIRLEERLRLAGLLGEPLRSRIGELTESQLVALRFASDAEVPALTARALAENLSNKDIKAAIQQWRPDYWRV